VTRHEDVARAALSRVYEPALVEALRPDSPLPGYRSADAIAIAVAVREESASRGSTVVLGDAEMMSIHTVGDLMREIDVLREGDTHE